MLLEEVEICLSVGGIGDLSRVREELEICPYGRRNRGSVVGVGGIGDLSIVFKTHTHTESRNHGSTRSKMPNTRKTCHNMDIFEPICICEHIYRRCFCRYNAQDLRVSCYVKEAHWMRKTITKSKYQMRSRIRRTCNEPP